MASDRKRPPEVETDRRSAASSGCPEPSKTDVLRSVVAKKRCLYPMFVSSASSSSTGASALLSVSCCLGVRKQACLLGALAAFQMVAVVTIIVSALGEAGSGGVGGGSGRLTPISTVASGSGSGFGESSSFLDRLNARLGGALAWGVPPPPSTDPWRHDELNVTEGGGGGSSWTRTDVDELNVTLIEMQTVLHGADCVETFLLHYEQFCDSTLVPSGGGDWTPLTTNGTAKTNSTNRRQLQQQQQPQRERMLELCPCVPRHRLVGRTKPTSDTGDSSTTGALTSDPAIDPGGRWFPRDCVARQRLAVIVPFRDREAHLQKFLRVVHPMLQRQLVDYTIFVVEQDQPKNIFNKASLMNAGFIEARAMGGQSRGESGGPFDCFLFHDVDMLPEDDRNFYGCGARLPRHVGAYVDKWNYNLMYHRIFGGATAFRPDVFELINGYSNEFYGWGGEDDDILNRIEAKNLTFVRFPKCVATYSMIKHDPDKRNPYNKASVVAWQRRPSQYETNGLNSLRYKLVTAERRPLYTWLLVTLPPPPT